MALGLIAHMDTATETSGAGVGPRIVKDYDGGTIVLNEALGMTMGPDVYESLNKHLGGGPDRHRRHHPLLGGGQQGRRGRDHDPGGVSPDPPGGAPRQAVHRLHPGRGGGAGANAFDIAAFGAALAYTVDGGELGELEYENFNAAAAEVEVTGNVIHPGYAKNKMKNAALIAARFQAMLPEGETPAHTEGTRASITSRRWRATSPTPG